MINDKRHQTFLTASCKKWLRFVTLTLSLYIVGMSSNDRARTEKDDTHTMIILYKIRHKASWFLFDWWKMKQKWIRTINWNCTFSWKLLTKHKLGQITYIDVFPLHSFFFPNAFLFGGKHQCETFRLVNEQQKNRSCL